MASIEATEEQPDEPSVTLTWIARSGILAVVLTGLLNGSVRLLAVRVFGVPNVFALWWEPVLIASAVGALGATIVYGILTRISSRPNRAFMLVAMGVLVLSFAGPVNAYLSPPPELAAAPWTVYATLIAMHVTAAAIITGLLTRTTTPVAVSR